MFDTAIIHCSDSEFGNALLINEWHLARGWAGCGYHYIILNGHPHTSKMYIPFLDGQVETGRPCDKRGAHCKGHNDTLGICLIGKHSFSSMQFMALEEIIKAHAISTKKIYPHNAFNKHKTCPNFDVYEWIEEYLGT